MIHFISYLIANISTQCFEDKWYEGMKMMPKILTVAVLSEKQNKLCSEDCQI